MTRLQRNLLWLGSGIQLVGGALMVWQLGWLPTIAIGIFLWGYGLTEEVRSEIKYLKKIL